MSFMRKDSVPMMMSGFMSHNLEESCRSLYVFSPIVAQPMWVQQSRPSHCRAFASHFTALRQMVHSGGRARDLGHFWRVVKVLLSMAVHRACSHGLQLSHWSALDLHDTPLSHNKWGAAWIFTYGLQGCHDMIFSLALLSDFFHTWKEVSNWIFYDGLISVPWFHIYIHRRYTLTFKLLFYDYFKRLCMVRGKGVTNSGDR